MSLSLNEKEKEVGKENFHAAIGSKLVRRTLLEESIRKGVASKNGLGPLYFGYGASVPEPVRVGVIGTGDEGSVLIGALNPNYIAVKAIADIRPYNVHRAFHGDYFTEAKTRPGLLAVYKWKTEDAARKEVKVYGDYRELIEHAKDDKLEAVIIALPLHLHAPVAIAAMRAGLHVITEKLMGHSVCQCKEMALTAKQTDLLLATGHQRHYSILYDNAKKLVRQGLLGELHFIRAQWHRGNLPGHNSWQPPLPPGVKTLAEDKNANKLADDLTKYQADLAEAEKKDRPNVKEVERLKAEIAQKEAQIADRLVDAKKFRYEDFQLKDEDGTVVYNRPALEELIRWRLWDRTGAGMMAELGSHQLDAASIFIAAVHNEVKQHPLTVAGAGNRPLFPPTAKSKITSPASSSFPPRATTPRTPLRRGRRSASNMPRSTATASAATAKPCWERKAPSSWKPNITSCSTRSPIPPARRRCSRARRKRASRPPSLPSNFTKRAMRNRRPSPGWPCSRPTAAMPKNSKIGPGASATATRNTSPVAIPPWPWATP